MSNNAQQCCGTFDFHQGQCNVCNLDIALCCIVISIILNCVTPFISVFIFPALSHGLMFKSIYLNHI